MVTDIDALNERLEDPTETFTSAEVQALIDWHVNNAYKDEYQRTRIVDLMTHNADVASYAKTATDKLVAMWDSSPMQPTLEVISYEQAMQG